MRKLLLPIALIAMLLLNTGCTTIDGDSSANSTDAPADSQDTSEDNGQATADSSNIKVAFISQVEGIPYFSGFNDGATEAAKEFGITYEQAGPATADSAEQLRIFDGLVKQGFNAIAISPLDPQSMNSAIEAARKKGIVVITSDADAPESQRQLFVQQATDEALGQTVFDEIAKAAGKKGKYGIISGAPDTDTFTRWIDAIQTRNKEKYPDMELVGGVRYTTTTAQALSETQNLMTANPDLVGVIAIPSTAVPGVAQAVRNANKSGEIAVSGFGSPQTAAPFIEDGSMTSTVLWDVPKLGRLTVWAMKQLIDGNDIKGSNTVPGIDSPVEYDADKGVLVLGPPSVFTKENVKDYSY